MRETWHVRSPALVSVSHRESTLRQIRTALGALAFANVGSCAGIGLGAGDTLSMAWLGSAVGAFVLLLLLASPREPRRRPGAWASAGGEVTVWSGARSLRFRACDVESAWVEASRVAQLRLRDGSAVSVEADDAEALPAALGLDEGARAMRVSLSSSASMSPFGTGATIFAVVVAFALGAAALVTSMSAFTRGSDSATVTAAAFGGIMGFAVVMGLAVMRLVQALVRPELIVGTDGLVSDALAGRLAFTDIARVHGEPRGVVVVRTNGARALLPLWSHGTRPFRFSGPVGSEPEATARALLGRIERALARRGGVVPGAEALDREGRPISEWRSALVGLAAAGGAYRGSALDSTGLVRVLDDQAQPLERRIGAAVALGAQDKELARERVRTVGEQCADGHVRVALERAVEGELDDDAIAEITRARR